MSEVTPSSRRPIEDRPVRVVSARLSFIQQIRSIWRSRELLNYMVVSDVRVKYKESALGIVWSMVAPALTLVIYYLVFGVLLKNGIPHFVIFLFSGLIVWNFVTNVVIPSTSVVVDRQAIVKKVAFPREILALSTLGAGLVYFVMQLVVLAIFMAIFRTAPQWSLLWLLPVALLGLVIIIGSIGLLLSALNVFLRDIKHLVEVFMQLWFYLTPIVYSYSRQVEPSLVHHGLTWLYFLNPVAPAVLTFQRIFYVHEYVQATTPGHAVLQVIPHWSTMHYLDMNLAVIGVGLVIFAVTMKIFGRLQGNFAQEL